MEKEFKKTLLEYIKIIVISVFVTFVVLQFVQVSKVVGSSMLPTYHEGTLLLVDTYFYKEPKVDDIVVVKYGNQQMVKRIIGVEGDCIELIDQQLYRNGVLVDEDYIYEKMNDEDFRYDVPQGCIFVMGDNRNNSMDSRMLGYFDFKEDVVGRVFFKAF